MRRVYSTVRRAVLRPRGLGLGQPRTWVHGRPISAPTPVRGWGDAMRDAQTDVPWPRGLRAQLAFKDSMVHGILQFTPSIAFRYVLHRCESRDIRCRESFCCIETTRSHRTSRKTGSTGRDFVQGPWRNPRRGWVGAGTNPGFGFLQTCSRVYLLSQVSTMILPQVHLRKPCYDFSFL